MRTTIDIPEPLFRELKVKAASQGTTLRELLLQGLEMVRQKPVNSVPDFVLPTISSTRKEKLVIDSETIYELIDLP